MDYIHRGSCLNVKFLHFPKNIRKLCAFRDNSKLYFILNFSTIFSISAFINCYTAIGANVLPSLHLHLDDLPQIIDHKRARMKIACRSGKRPTGSMEGKKFEEFQDARIRL